MVAYELAASIVTSCLPSTPLHWRTRLSGTMQCFLLHIYDIHEKKDQEGIKVQTRYVQLRRGKSIDVKLDVWDCNPWCRYDLATRTRD
jgi:hypothetical protein